MFNKLRKEMKERGVDSGSAGKPDAGLLERLKSSTSPVSAYVTLGVLTGAIAAGAGFVLLKNDAPGISSEVMRGSRVSQETSDEPFDLENGSSDAATGDESDSNTSGVHSVSSGSGAASSVKPARSTTNFDRLDDSSLFAMEKLDDNSFMLRLYDAKANGFTKEVRVETDKTVQFGGESTETRYTDFNAETGDFYFLAYDKEEVEAEVGIDFFEPQYHLMRVNVTKPDEVVSVVSSEQVESENGISWAYMDSPVAHPFNSDIVYVNLRSHSDTNSKIGSIAEINTQTGEVDPYALTYSLSTGYEQFRSIQVTGDESRLIVVTTEDPENRRADYVNVYELNLRTDVVTRDAQVFYGYLYNGTDYAVNTDGSKIAFIAHGTQWPARLHVVDRVNDNQVVAYRMPAGAGSGETQIVWNEDDSRVYLALKDRTVYLDVNLKEFVTIRAGIDPNTFSTQVASTATDGIHNYVVFVMTNIRNHEKSVDVYNASTGEIMTDVPAHLRVAGLQIGELEMF